MSGYTPRNPEKDRDLDQAVWTVAQRLQEFSYHSLGAEAHQNQYTVATFVKRWIAAGAVVAEGVGAGGRHQFKVVKAADETPSRIHRKLEVVSTDQAMWIAARRAGSFTALDIAAVAATEEAPVSVDMARAYIQMLLAAGYLRIIRKGVHGKVPASYRLINDTGPLSPITRRVTVTVDPNKGQIVHVPKVAK